jgi:hypothetical protein
MFREDIKVIAVNPDDGMKFGMGFYKTCDEDVWLSDIENMINYLDAAMKTIDGASVHRE